MHVLVTTDTISGVWSYTRELVSGLVSRGLRVTLVSFGEVPLPEQASWMDSLHGLDYRPTGFRLEWMHEGEQDYARVYQDGKRSPAAKCPIGEARADVDSAGNATKAGGREIAEAQPHQKPVGIRPRKDETENSGGGGQARTHPTPT